MKCDQLPKNQDELLKALADPWWRLNNLYAIKPKSGGVKKFKPNFVQKLIYQSYWWLNEILKSRQHGVSTFWVVFFLDRVVFEPDKTAGVIDITEKDAKKKLGMAKTAYDNMDNPEVHPDTWRIGKLVKQKVRMIKGQQAPSPEELVFSNGSSFYAGVSFRGGTLQYGLFTEFGKIAHKYPMKAAEIVEGAENAMHEGSIAAFEFTMEGGQSGLAYERLQKAMKNPRDRSKLTRLDGYFMFFGWYEDPANQLSDEQAKIIMARIADTNEVDTRNGKFNWKEYFYGDNHGAKGALERLSDEMEVDLTTNQMAWYINKRIGQGWAMLKEHPTFAEEAFQAPVKGAIYAEQILRAEVEERVSDFNPQDGKMVHTTWDIGSNANTVVTYWQKVAAEWRVIDCDHDMEFTFEERVAHMNNKGYNYGTHALPHDAAHQKIGNITTKQVLVNAGLKNVKVIPVTSSVDLRIDGMWGLLPNIRFRKSHTEKLLRMLKSYRYKEEKSGAYVTDVIVKDETNHYADAFGYLWEAEQASLFSDTINITKGKAIRKANVKVGGL